VLNATRHKWTHPALTPSHAASKLVLDLPTRRDGRLSWPRLPGNAPARSRTRDSRSQVRRPTTTPPSIIYFTVTVASNFDFSVFTPNLNAFISIPKWWKFVEQCSQYANNVRRIWSRKLNEAFWLLPKIMNFGSTCSALWHYRRFTAGKRLSMRILDYSLIIAIAPIYLKLYGELCHIFIVGYTVIHCSCQQAVTDPQWKWPNPTQPMNPTRGVARNLFWGV